MAADRDPPGLIDYVVTAISPALVMLMVGSLVFFLVEVLYAGKYEGRLLYSLFFFVAGSVLVARIGIQIDRGRAGAYGVFLGLAAFAAISAYVDYPKDSPLGRASWLANLGLLALVYWSANKLTWDCTHLDDTQDVSGRGVLSAAGFGGDEAGGGQSQESGVRSQGAEDRANPERKRGGKKKKKKSGPNWLWRWHEHRQAQKKKPHTPGVWVIYFALAALPLFAVGQSLIDPEDADRRRAAFLQMVVYIASALGLLATTSLLGLRRYLRQRKATMPGSLTAGWLGLGAGLTVLFVVVGAALPRPHSETPLVDIVRAGKAEREASRYAQRGDGAGKGDGAEGEETEKGAGKASGKGGDHGGSKGQKGSGGKGDKGKGGGGKNGKSGGSKGGKGEDGKGKQGDDGGKGSEEKGEDKDESRDGATDREARDAKEGKSGDRQASGKQPETQVGQALQKVAGVVKWVVIAVVVVLVVVGIALAVLKYLAPFTGWAQRLLDAIRNWWANLFGGRKGASRAVAEAAPAGPARPPPFTAFSDPFADGTAGGRDTAELVAYTFAALDAWAWDRGHGRRADETPLEFAGRLAGEYPDIGAELRRFAGRYARVAYAEGPPPADTRRVLEQVWDQLVHGVGAVAVAAAVE